MKKRLAKIDYEIELNKLQTIHDRKTRLRCMKKQRRILKLSLSLIKKSVEEVTREVVESHIEKQEDQEKTTEDDVRDHLRGLPTILLSWWLTAAQTTLANFDQKIDPATFLELTSITLDEFRKLRDGFEYLDEKGKRNRSQVFSMK